MKENDTQSSKQGEFHPKLLTEPYVNLSLHTPLLPLAYHRSGLINAPKSPNR